MLVVVFGRLAPLWHDTQVTRRVPPKYVLLMVFIITIILRAISFLSVSLAYSPQPPPPSPTWQYVQLTANALAMNPIDPRNSSAGTPFRTWMFLNTSSAICCFGAGAAWAPTKATAARKIAALHRSFMRISNDKNDVRERRVYST